MEYYTALKVNNPQIDEEIWDYSQKYMPKKRSQAPEASYSMVSVYNVREQQMIRVLTI